MLDVGWGDVIYYMGDDPHTSSILIYMETIGDARAFMSAAREVALTKPIIVIKPGRTGQAAKAAASHTGSLTGSDDVLQAAFRRVGVLRVDHISDLFGMAEVLAKQPRPKGPNLTIVTNAGGPGVLATDVLIQGGGHLTDLSPATMAAYDEVLPAVWSHNNPVDIIGDAPPERYVKALEIAAADPAADGMLIILTPQAMSDPTRTAQELVAVRPHRRQAGPRLVDGRSGRGGRGGHPPPGRHPDLRVPRHGDRDVQRAVALRAGPARPVRDAEPARRRRAGDGPGRGDAPSSAALARPAAPCSRKSSQRPCCRPMASPSPRRASHPPPTRPSRRPPRIGYPVVLKLYSHTITHKTDVGGVQLDLADEAAVRAAYEAIRAGVTKARGAEHFEGVTVQPMIDFAGYELIIGSSIDPQFGPVLLFGMGGQLVELFRDRAIGLPPLNTTLARRLIERTKISGALKGIRGRRPIDVDALEQLLVRFSLLVVEQRWIKEIDINPLLASPERLLALDARVVLHDASVAEADLPRLAIRPYPRQYEQPWTAPDGASVLIRPIRPEDEPAMVQFHAELTEETVYSRYFEHLGLSQRTAHERLTRICFNDYDREIALVAEETDARRRPADRRRGPPLQGARASDRRVRRPRGRPLAAPRAGGGAAASPGRRRPRRGPGAPLGGDARGQHGHAPYRRGGRLHDRRGRAGVDRSRGADPHPLTGR